MLREVTDNEKRAFAKKKKRKERSLWVYVAHHVKITPTTLFYIFFLFFNQMCTKVIWYKIELKNSFGLLIFCIGCADLIPFSTCLRKNYFLSRIERFRTFYIVSSTSNVRQMEKSSLSPPTNGFPSNAYECNLSGKCVWLMLIILNTMKWRFFWPRFKTGKNRHCI